MRLGDELENVVMRLDLLFDLTMVHPVSREEKLRKSIGDVGAIVP